MRPTLAEYEKSGASWHRTHCGIRYQLSHHGISDYSPEGTWCYYLFLNPAMFQNPADFAKFDKAAEIKEWHGGKFWQTYDYYEIPDLDFHGGVTWYSKEAFFDRYTGKDSYCLKIGCDYNHSWDQDGGYWQGLEDVDRDAKRSIDILVASFPMNEVCAYSGRIDHPDKFYTAVNGQRVHVSHADSFEDGWASWRPAVAALAKAGAA